MDTTPRLAPAALLLAGRAAAAVGNYMGTKTKTPPEGGVFTIWRRGGLPIIGPSRSNVVLKIKI